MRASRLTKEPGFGTGLDHLSLGRLMNGATEVTIKIFGTDNSGGEGGVSNYYALSLDGGRTWPIELQGNAPVWLTPRNAVRAYNVPGAVILAGGVGVLPGGGVGTVVNCAKVEFVDGVLTWTELTASMTNILGADGAFAKHPITHDLYNIGGSGNPYIQKSTDLGVTWTNVADLPAAYSTATAITATFYGVDDANHLLYFTGSAAIGETAALYSWNPDTGVFAVVNDDLMAYSDVAGVEELVWEDQWATLIGTVDALGYVRGTRAAGGLPDRKGLFYAKNPALGFTEANYAPAKSHARGRTLSLDRTKAILAGGVDTIGDPTGGPVWEFRKLI